MAGEIKQLRKDVEHNHDKIERLEGKVENERLATDSSIASMMSSLHKIDITVTKIMAQMESQNERIGEFIRSS